MRGNGTNGTEDAAGSGASVRNGTSSSSHNKASIANVLNGSATDHSSSNGAAHFENRGTLSPNQKPRAPTFYGHDREEVTRILIQGLHDLGYNGAAENLSEESGFDLETRYASSFREAILDGNWEKAENLLSDTSLPEDGGGVGISNGFNGHSGHDDAVVRRQIQHAQVGLPLSEDADKGEMLFWIRRQKYLELLETGIEGGNLNDALVVLRQQLQPLHQDERQLHALSSLIMCTSTEELKYQAEWDGAHGQSRRQLLSELSRSISPSVMIPEHRLANLFTHVKDNQVESCLYHNSAEWPSLYHDHRCEHDQLPLQTLMDLDQHLDEVWYLQFSHDGTKLASAGKDSKVYIYDTESFRVLRILSEHKDSVSYVAWSPDDSRLITCSQDKSARVWDVNTGICKRLLEFHQNFVTTAAWTHDSAYFATGAHDPDRPLSLWSRDARTSSPIHTFTDCSRVQDCAISAPTSSGIYSFDDSETPNRPARLVVVCVDHSINVFDISRREKLIKFPLAQQVTSLNLSSDGMEMLVNHGSDEIWAIDLDTGETKHRFKGQKQGQFVIRSCFGGASEGFVVSGGEDARISIWHRHTGTLLEKFPGHSSGCVNAVAWNTSKPYMFASAGDDSIVRIWVSKAAMTSHLQYRRMYTPERFHDMDDAPSGDERQSLQSLPPPGPPQWGGGGSGVGTLPSFGGR